MTMRFNVVLVFALIGFPLSTAFADEIRVPADQPTIQDGIDVARPDDEVVIAPGTYTGPRNREIDFKGKAITVRSERGAETCIIDCQGEGFGFIFQNGESQNSVLEGLTIEDGEGDYWNPGDAIICFGSSPTIRNNVLRECDTYTKAVIYCGDGASPVIEHNMIRDCWGLDTCAVYCENGSSPLVTDNQVTGIQCRDGAVGLRLRNGCSPMVINNLFSGNNFCHGSVIDMADHCDPLLLNNTIAKNDSNGCPSYGVEIYSECSPTLVNCIIWESNAIGFQYGGSPVIRYCDIEGRDPHGTGCINADPLFVSGPLGDYYLSQVAAGQAADSPCLDTGDPGTSSPGGTTRTDEEPDIGPADMGYHYSSFASFCDLDGSGRVDGIDLSIFSTAFGAAVGEGRYNGSADLDRNGIVDGDDLVLFASCFGTTV